MGCILRVVVPSILFILVLLSMTFQQVSLVWLLRILYQQHISVETRYLTIFILILVPYLFAGIQLIWNTSFISKSNSAHLPKWKNILLGITISILEGLCVFVFTVEVAAHLPAFIFLPLRNAVFGFPILIEILPWNKRSKTPTDGVFRGSRHWSGTPPACNTDFNKLVFSLAAALTPLTLGILLHVEGHITLTQTISLVLSLWGLAVAWSPKILIRSFASPCGLENTSKRIQSLYLCFKIVSLSSSLAIYANLEWTGGDTSVQILSGLQAMGGKDVIVPFALNLGSGLVAYGLTYAALALCVPLVGICVPVAASTPIAVFICAVFLTSLAHSADDVPLAALGPYVYVAATVASLIWVALFLLKYKDFGRSPRVLNAPHGILFLNNGWNSVFFDQFLFLGYQADGFGRIPPTQLMTNKSRSKVFLCTTMFREADHEMERALESYQRLSYSDKFDNVHLEVHVIMDSGCTGNEVQPFAHQLLSLIGTTLCRKVENGVCYLTPYGIQIRWILRGGLPLFVHLKDPDKVKSKKRWSQALYITYIIHHRAKLLSDRHKWNLEDSEEADALETTKISMPSDKKEKSVLSSATSGFIDQTSNSYTETSSRIASGISTITDTIGNGCDEAVTPPTDKSESPEVQRQKPASPSQTNALFDNRSSSNICEVPLRSNESPINTGDINEDFEGGNMESIHRDKNERSLKSGPSSLNQNSINRRSLSDYVKILAIIRNKRFSTTYKARKGLQVDLAMPANTSNEEKAVCLTATTPGSENQFFSPSGPSTNIAIENKDLEGDKCGYASEKSFRDCLEETAIAVPQRAKTPDDTSKDGHHVVNVIGTNHPGTIAFEEPVWLDDQTYILATDADTEFQPQAVVEALGWCNQDRTLGAVCGRIHPVGKTDRLIVWHQIFEYSVDFWNLKTTQNSIGSVLCAPGCFSLYRAISLNQILQTYTSPTVSPLGVYVKDTGEDRWMTTLMMLEGWGTRFCPLSHNTTFCPDTFDEFLKQRRRWILSDYANTFIVLRHIVRLMRNNEDFSVLFIVYQSIVFSSTVLSVGSSIFIITAGLDLIFAIDYLYTTPILAVVVVIYAILCTRLGSRAQTHLTVALTAVLGCIFFAVVAWGFVFYVKVAMQESLTHDQKVLQYYVVVVLIATVGIPALCYLPEANRACYGIAYAFTFPLVHCLIHVYSVCNIVDQSWGTREGNVSKRPQNLQNGIWKDQVTSLKNPEDGGTEQSAPQHNSRPEDRDGVVMELRPLEMEGEGKEYEFWLRTIETVLGNKVNLGMDKTELTARLGPLRNKFLIGFLLVNFIWLFVISFFYVEVSVTIFQLNALGLFVAVFYGFCLCVRFVGLVTSRADLLFRKLAEVLYGHTFPMWITYRKGKNCW